MDAYRLERVAELCQRYVTSGAMPCTEIGVWRHGTPVLRRTFGMMDQAAGVPLADDSMFRIYSMTKPLTCVAALVCYEMGRPARPPQAARQWGLLLAPRTMIPSAASQRSLRSQAATILTILSRCTFLHFSCRIHPFYSKIHPFKYKFHHFYQVPSRVR